MAKIKTLLMSLGLASGLGLGACDNQTPPNPIPTTDPNQPAMAVNHDDIIGAIPDVTKDGNQIPPSQSERLHACGKITLAALRASLAARNVNMTNMAPTSAGGLYSGGLGVMGVANYPARQPEGYRSTTGGIVKLYDLMLAVADELIPDNTTDNLGASTACPVVKFFNPDNTCNADGFGCFMGTPPSANQLSLCNSITKDPTISDPAIAKRIAIAALASPTYLCD